MCKTQKVSSESLQSMMELRKEIENLEGDANY